MRPLLRFVFRSDGIEIVIMTGMIDIVTGIGAINMGTAEQ
jgi:hypothetical protein